MLVAWSWWQFLSLMSELRYWWHLLNLGECWWPKWSKWSPTSQSCHQHLSSRTSVTNNDVTTNSARRSYEWFIYLSVSNKYSSEQLSNIKNSGERFQKLVTWLLKFKIECSIWWNCRIWKWHFWSKIFDDFVGTVFMTSFRMSSMDRIGYLLSFEEKRCSHPTVRASATCGRFERWFKIIWLDRHFGNVRWGRRWNQLWRH